MKCRIWSGTWPQRVNLLTSELISVFLSLFFRENELFSYRWISQCCWIWNYHDARISYCMWRKYKSTRVKNTRYCNKLIIDKVKRGISFFLLFPFLWNETQLWNDSKRNNTLVNKVKHTQVQKGGMLSSETILYFLKSKLFSFSWTWKTRLRLIWKTSYLGS